MPARISRQEIKEAFNHFDANWHVLATVRGPRARAVRSSEPHGLTWANQRETRTRTRQKYRFWARDRDENEKISGIDAVLDVIDSGNGLGDKHQLVPGVYPCHTSENRVRSLDCL